MFNFIFQFFRSLQQRLTNRDSAEDTARTIAFDPDAGEEATTQSIGSGTKSIWQKLFGPLFGKTKADPKPEGDAKAPEPEKTIPEPETEKTTVTKKVVFTPRDEKGDQDKSPAVPDTGARPDPVLVVDEDIDDVPEADLVAEETIPDVATGTDEDLETATEEEAPTGDRGGPVDADPAPELTQPATIARQFAPTTLDSGAAVNVAGGRVTTFTLPDAANITDVKITNLPAHGNVTVNPDFTLALVLSGSDYSGPLSFDYSVSRADNSVTTHTATLEVATPTQGAGWGLGNHYMLATDADDKIVVEHGDNHRKVYISGSEDALSRADIAALEGVSESVITTQWLRNNPEYGGSDGMALTAEIGMELWYGITARGQAPSSNWLLFERGYEYDNVGQIITRGLTSESEMHPVHVTAYGEGARPLLNTKIQIWQEQSDNIVFSELAVTGGAAIFDGDNVIMSHMGFSEAGLNVRDAENFTFRYSEITDSVSKSAPPAVGEEWKAVAQGILVVGTDGVLMEGNIFHHNGWQDTYLIDGSGAGGMASSMYSHNVYLQYDTTDVTFRDNITSQSSSYGAHIRGGGFAQNNLFLDNNVAVSLYGGNYKDFGFVGNFSLFTDNVVTSGGYKIAPRDGASAWGIQNSGLDTVMLNNIITHLSNPDDPDEQAHKTLAQMAFREDEKGGSAFYNDSIVLNWQGSERSGDRAANRNLDDVDIATAMATTIQRYAAEFLDVPLAQISDGTQMSGYYQSKLITDLMNHLLAERDADGGQMFSARDIVDYFQAGFNIAASGTGATDHRFVPNDLGDGVRWDNRLNWTSDQLPTDGDTVDLGGNWVNFGGTVALNSLDLGSAGKLQVGSGKLSVDQLATGDDGMIFVERAGQLWTDGYAGGTLLSLHVTGGRFANTGDFTGPVIASVKDGQMILATDDAAFTLGAKSELRMEGSTAKIGFDGSVGGVATLLMQAGGQMSFVADSAGLATIQEFRSGAWDQAGSNVQSGVALDGTLTLDLSNHIGIANMNLIKVDAISGMFDEINIHGLGSNRDAELVIDYAADLVTLQLSSGTGQGSISIIGDAAYGGDEDAALWDALTSGRNLDGDLNAPITILDDVIDPLAEMNFI